MKKIIAMFLCLTICMSAGSFATYGGLGSSSDLYSFYDGGKLGNSSNAAHVVEYIEEIVENYYELTGARVLIQLHTENHSVLERMLDKNLPIEEALDKYTTELIKYAKNQYPTTDKWISIGYYGEKDLVYVAQQGIEALSEDDILELKAIAADGKKGMPSRMYDFLATIFHKLYSELNYKENPTNKELVKFYEQMHNAESESGATPVIIMAVLAVCIIGYIVVKKKEKKA